MNETTIKALYASGKLQIKNRTQQYLVPTLYDYGKEFTEKMRQFSSPACGIGDMNISDPNLTGDPSIYFLLNIERSQIRRFSYDMLYFRRLPQYANDYPFGELLYSKLHMLVIKIPDRYYDAYYNFLAHKYSKMYNKKEAYRLFLYGPNDPAELKNRKKKALQAVTLDEELKTIIAEEYGVNPNIITELDSQWNPKDEIFNYYEQTL